METLSALNKILFQHPPPKTSFYPLSNTVKTPLPAPSTLVSFRLYLSASRQQILVFQIIQNLTVIDDKRV